MLQSQVHCTSANLRPAWRKEDSKSVWTLETRIRLDGGEERGLGESTGEGDESDEGEGGRVGGKS